jgi:hypothetical protein
MGPMLAELLPRIIIQMAVLGLRAYLIDFGSN